MKTKLIGVRVPVEMEKRARQLAESEQRTLSNYVMRLIIRDLENRAAQQAPPEHEQKQEQEQHGADTRKKQRRNNAA